MAIRREGKPTPSNHSLHVYIFVHKHVCISCCMGPSATQDMLATVMMYSPRAAGPRDYIITVPTYPV